MFRAVSVFSSRFHETIRELWSKIAALWTRNCLTIANHFIDWACLISTTTLLYDVCFENIGINFSILDHTRLLKYACHEAFARWTVWNFGVQKLLDIIFGGFLLSFAFVQNFLFLFTRRSSRLLKKSTLFGFKFNSKHQNNLLTMVMATKTPNTSANENTACMFIFEKFDYGFKFDYLFC